MKPRAIYEVDTNGKLQWYPHKFQMQAARSRARFTFLPKGWRGGFTSWIPKLLESEMRRCGPGHSNLAYFAIAPTLQVAKKPGSMQPSLETYFCTYMRYATYNKVENKFLTTPEGERALWGHEQKERTPIVVCHAADPDSFASATFLGGVADEVGQTLFKREAWNTLRSRMATTCGEVAPNNSPEMKGVKMGRVFAGSTVYTPNWFVELYEQWKQFMLAKKDEMEAQIAHERDPEIQKAIRDEFNRRAYLGITHPEMTFIRFDSTANPTFSKDEMERLRELWPSWFFDMRLRAIPRKPAGVIYDEFDPVRHMCDPFHIPRSWPRDIAIDFGKRNFYATMWAHDVERDRHICYMSYHRTDLDNFGHAEEILAQLAAEGVTLSEAVAGQISEGTDRTELAIGGINALPPLFKDLWDGITAGSIGFKANKVLIFRNKPYEGMPTVRDGFEVGGEGLAEELRTYSRPVDPDTGIPKMDEDPENKDTYHWNDSYRYRSTRKFTAMMRANRQSVRAGGRVAATPSKAPDVVAAPDVRAAQVMAGSGSSRTQFGLYQKYGNAGMMQPHLDINLD